MYSTHVERLAGVARDIASGEREKADRELRALLEEVACEPDPRAINIHVFGGALARRLSGATADEANLYLSRYDVPQIHLFNLLATSVPAVALAGAIANGAIERACLGEERPTIIDVGVGTGRQVVALLESMASAKTLPRSLTVIGIEPSEWSLDLARRNVEDAARRVGADVTFHPFLGAAEKLTEGDWRRMKAACTGRPVVNGSFALHHIGDIDGEDVRNEVLLRLRWLEPRLLVLSEPNVDHHEPDFLRRFDNCWRHFGAVFDAVDSTAADRRDKDSLKACFFGREIADILSNPEELRSERHESTRSWLLRLVETGWQPRLDGELPAGGDIIAVREKDGYASLDFGEVPLVSVLCAAPEGVLAEAEQAIARAPAGGPSPG
jgi:hypothetical protein